MQRYEHFLNYQTFLQLFFLKKIKSLRFSQNLRLLGSFLFLKLVAAAKNTQQIDEQIDEVKVERQGSKQGNFLRCFA